MNRIPALQLKGRARQRKKEEKDGPMEDSRKEFLEQLELKKRKLQDTLSQLMKIRKEANDELSDDSPGDESDDAQREISLFSNCSLIEKKSRELITIDHIIKKILRDQEFGICEECGDPIPEERLVAVPETGLCVFCQRELEKSLHLRNAIRSVMSHSGSAKSTELDWSCDLDEVHYGLMDSELDLLPAPIPQDHELDTRSS
jgi:DnaK suppressor protein